MGRLEDRVSQQRVPRGVEVQTVGLADELDGIAVAVERRVPAVGSREHVPGVDVGDVVDGVGAVFEHIVLRVG